MGNCSSGAASAPKNDAKPIHQSNARPKTIKDTSSKGRTTATPRASARETVPVTKQQVIDQVKNKGGYLRYVDEMYKNDRDVVMAAVQNNGFALRYASDALKEDYDIVMAAISKSDGNAMEYAHPSFRDNHQFVFEAVQQSPNVLKLVSPSLRSDKEIIVEAVKKDSSALKWALGGLHQDADCLAAAGIFDAEYRILHRAGEDIPVGLDTGNDTGTTAAGTASVPNTHVRNDNAKSINNTENKIMKKVICFSTKFSLGEQTDPIATRIYTALKKRHVYFPPDSCIMYFPNAWDKNTCDPNWTNRTWPCRGTYETCQMSHDLKVGVPQEKQCCWRYSYRYQLERSLQTGGYMIQICQWDKSAKPTDTAGTTGSAQHMDRFQLGDGQKIETEMALSMGLHIFRVYAGYGYMYHFRNEQEQEGTKRIIDGIQRHFEIASGQNINDVTNGKTSAITEIHCQNIDQVNKDTKDLEEEISKLRSRLNV